MQVNTRCAGLRSSPAMGVSPRAVRVHASKPHNKSVTASAADSSSARRNVLLGGSLLLVSGLLQPVIALADEVAAPTAPTSSIYSDDADKFTFTPPAGWAMGEGALGGASGYTGASGQRRTLAWFPTDANPRDVNITVVITNVSVEFTKLGSFGNVDTFAGNLISSLDRSYLLRKGFKSPLSSNEPVQIAKLVDYRSKDNGNQYEVEYTVQKLPEPQRHLLSVVQLGSNGTYNRLYTFTAQCLEEDLDKYRPKLEAAMKTFKASVKTLV